MEWKYKLVEITATRKIREASEHAEKYKELIAIVGETGFGKSIGVQLAKLEKKWTVMEIMPAETTKAFFSKFINVVNNESQKKDVYTQQNLQWLIEEACFHFLDDRNNTLLVIDEAGNFGMKSQSFLRQIWDTLQGQSGMILCGTPRYKKDFIQWSKDDATGIPEFGSRINKWVTLNPPNYQDVKKICKANAVEHQKIIRFIYENSPNLRKVRNYIIEYHRGNLYL